MHFFMDAWQCTPDHVHMNNLVLRMKYCYFVKFEMISFSIGRANLCQQNLHNFEYWIVNNATVRLEHLGKLNLKWKSAKSVTFKALCDVSAYKAVGVETCLKRKQMTQEEWDTMMEKLCKKMIRDQKEAHKKRIRNPPQIPDSVLYKKCTKKEERDVEARRKDALSRPPHFWESFYNHVEKKEEVDDV